MTRNHRATRGIGTMNKLEGKVALFTGASRGIGAAIAVGRRASELNQRG